MPKIRKHRGGQPGNQNARKHGFYAINFTPSEIREYLELVYSKRIDCEAAAIRIKLKSILENDPSNRRALMQAVKVLSIWAVSKYHLNHEEGLWLKRNIRSLFINAVHQKSGSGSSPAIGSVLSSNSTERSIPDDKKMGKNLRNESSVNMNYFYLMSTYGPKLNADC